MSDKQQMVTEETALKGRFTPLEIEDSHFVNHSRLTAEPEKGQQKILIGMGCFWGAERLFWQLPGVISTSVGYSGGYTPNPTYEEVCTGQTGHAEVVRVIYQPQQISLETLLGYFWENHDPTQGMRQGNDLGTQYRSVIYVYHDKQRLIAEHSRQTYQKSLNSEGKGQITTEILSAGPYYFAESYHQQYLAKNPDGYCGLAGTGVCFMPL
ncbi:peptide-methionine (S)-S-oxide reductase MsrA [Vibrio ruber]|uniref:Peptide methionine sulfoxide reductase MsrA n=1 Tax=Vibrio ruber (strain DSM 16370 / JCM 11486 / BCRC 17186 / CECT 7878 / LMG 23124 / VR1) TaxID=1123498 RepID=A0A1R4LMI0_VIBR1|nr:peptide-methionine (S)-S-oxide reductase MsrA [Vibrio ruber]WNJ96302.1 peptide-methionine (S)-S-oxide reductase MsrA [Vibrio ruber]SJN57663.1 Peptide methionine sulfoxide reductase MsrA [Vibrio ruber DSM 16370]